MCRLTICCYKRTSPNGTAQEGAPDTDRARIGGKVVSRLLQVEGQSYVSTRSVGGASAYPERAAVYLLRVARRMGNCSSCVFHRIACDAMQKMGGVLQLDGEF